MATGCGIRVELGEICGLSDSGYDDCGLGGNKTTTNVLFYEFFIRIKTTCMQTRSNQKILATILSILLVLLSCYMFLHICMDVFSSFC